MNQLLTRFIGFAIDNRIAKDAFIVGGTPRDILLGRAVKDVDIAVRGGSFSIAQTFAALVHGSFVPLDEKFGIARVVHGAEYLDLCAMRGNTIEEDLAARDFSINAMALPVGLMPPEKISFRYSDLVDPFSGRADLDNKIIRMVSGKNLTEDPLRMLRAYRFSATLGFSIEQQTAVAIALNRELIAASASERVAEELRLILTSDSSSAAVAAMAASSLLYNILPELSYTSKKHEERLIRICKKTDHILSDPESHFGRHAGAVASYFYESASRLFALKLAILLSDPATAEQACRRLKLSTRESLLVQIICSTEAASKMDTEDEIIRLLQRANEDIYAVMTYMLVCDDRQIDESGVSALADFYRDKFLPRLRLLPVITGNDLIEIFSLEPSPLFSDILQAVELQVLKGKISSKASALRLAEEIIEDHKHAR